MNKTIDFFFAAEQLFTLGVSCGALLPVTMREGWLQNWPEIACVLWFRARKWREVAVLLVPVRKWLEIAWLLCGLQHGIRASVPFVNQVRDLFRKKWGTRCDSVFYLLLLWIYLFPALCCVLLLLVTYLPGPVPVSFVCIPI